ncbi:unnamed protein product [Camellia sinensis]
MCLPSRFRCKATKGHSFRKCRFCNFDQETDQAGKHADLWSQKTNQNQNQNQKQKVKDDNKNNNKGQKQQGLAKRLEAFKNQQHKFLTAFCSEAFKKLMKNIQFVHFKKN